jgi:hypothetical protein
MHTNTTVGHHASEAYSPDRRVGPARDSPRGWSLIEVREWRGTNGPHVLVRVAVRLRGLRFSLLTLQPHYYRICFRIATMT